MRGRLAWLALPVALAGVAVLSTSPAGAGPKEAEVRYRVRSSEAPAFEILGGKGVARLLLDETTGSRHAAISELVIAPGGKVPLHAHEKGSEYLYVLEGRARFVVAGRTLEAGPGDALHLPEGVEHSAEVLGRHLPLRAVQVYAPGGAEQRFRQGTPASLE